MELGCESRTDGCLEFGSLLLDLLAKRFRIMAGFRCSQAYSWLSSEIPGEESAAVLPAGIAGVIIVGPCSLGRPRHRR